MKHSLMLLMLFVTTVIFLSTVDASKAGIGVINVPPTYKGVWISEGNDFITLKLSISDYNSWKDIYKVDVLIVNSKDIIAHFICMHYESKDSFNEINKFEEIKGRGYLIPDMCSVERSLYERSVDERCVVNITFIFKPIPSSNEMIITSYDRDNQKCVVNISYGEYENQRNNEIIVPFWSGSPVKVSPDVPNISAGSMSITLVAFIMYRRWKKWKNLI